MQASTGHLLVEACLKPLRHSLSHPCIEPSRRLRLSSSGKPLLSCHDYGEAFEQVPFLTRPQASGFVRPCTSSVSLLQGALQQLLAPPF